MWCSSGHFISLCTNMHGHHPLCTWAVCYYYLSVSSKVLWHSCDFLYLQPKRKVTLTKPCMWSKVWLFLLSFFFCFLLLVSASRCVSFPVSASGLRCFSFKALVGYCSKWAQTHTHTHRHTLEERGFLIRSWLPQVSKAECFTCSSKNTQTLIHLILKLTSFN